MRNSVIECSSKPKFSIGITLLYFLFDKCLRIPIETPLFDYLILYGSRFFAIFLLFKLFSNRIRKQTKIVLFILLSYLLTLSFSTLIGGDFRSLLRDNLPIVGITILLFVYSASSNSLKNFIYSISWWYFFATIINLLLILVNPEMFGMTPGGIQYFIGKENGVGYPLLVGFVFNYLDFYFNNNKIKLFLYTTIYIITTIVVFSASSVVAMFFILGVLTIPVVNKIFSKLSLNLCFLLYILLSIVIVLPISANFTNNFVVTYMVENLLGKDMSFSGRVETWAVIIPLIADKPIIGHGVQTSLSYFWRPDLYGEMTTHMSHNQIVQCLYEGGLVSLLIIGIFLAFINKQINASEDVKLNSFFKAVIIGLFIMYMMENPGFQPFFIISTLAVITLNYKSL